MLSHARCAADESWSAMRRAFAAIIIREVVRSTLNSRVTELGKADIIAAVRSAIVTNDLLRAMRLAQGFRDRNGATPEALEALSWVARGALNARRLDEAVEYAQQTHRLGVRRLKRASLDFEPHLATALGASIEVLAQAMEKRGLHGEAVRFLNRQFAKFGTTPIKTRIRKTLNVLTIEGQPAPELEIRQWLGAKPPSLAKLRGRPVLLFFWAHYCEDSRAEARILIRIRKQFGPAGLALLGPTRRYGYLDEHRRKPAGPGREKQHMEQVLSRYYNDLQDMPVIISERNFVTYGASTTPTLVLIDCDGFVSLYHPGKIAYNALAQQVKRMLKKCG
jgi:thiol-disulfide isomerase/thioredoxin